MASLADTVGAKVRVRLRGKMGEIVVGILMKSLPKNEYKIINNLLIETEKGTSQVDHVVVSQYGIFVIETKTYSGWIVGSEHSAQWTEVVHGQKYRFQNPLWQNYGHVKSLEQFLNLSDEKLISIIAFSGETTLKVKTAKHVIKIGDLTDTIKTYNKKILGVEETEEVFERLKHGNIKSFKEKHKHVKNINKELKEKQEKVGQNICPSCGGELVKRKGKYGIFWGCSNFPTCRFTTPYDDDSKNE